MIRLEVSVGNLVVLSVLSEVLPGNLPDVLPGASGVSSGIISEVPLKMFSGVTLDCYLLQQFHQKFLREL